MPYKLTSIFILKTSNIFFNINCGSDKSQIAWCSIMDKMFKIVSWNSALDLSEFYSQAEKRGFTNNSSQKMLIDSLAKENKWNVWILYYKNNAVGSVGAHSFPEMGKNAFRIAVRTCIFTDMLPYQTLRTKNQIVTHQHITSQYFIPICIDWCPKNTNLYITSNENTVGAQQLVHRIFCPIMEKTGQLSKVCDMIYRGSNQTVWQLHVDKFLHELNKYPRWTKS